MCLSTKCTISIYIINYLTLAFNPQSVSTARFGSPVFFSTYQVSRWDMAQKPTKNPASGRDGCCFGCCPDKNRMVSSEASTLPEVSYSIPAFLKAAMRLVTLNLVNIFFTCFLTVSSLINSFPAICLLLHPRAIHFITSCSLFVSPVTSLLINTAMLPFLRLNLIKSVTRTSTYLWVFLKTER
jgi:hypothetical protein